MVLSYIVTCFGIQFLSLRFSISKPGESRGVDPWACVIWIVRAGVVSGLQSLAWRASGDSQANLRWPIRRAQSVSFISWVNPFFIH
jgi:hypothetical protein